MARWQGKTPLEVVTILEEIAKNALANLRLKLDEADERFRQMEKLLRDEGERPAPPSAEQTGGEERTCPECGESERGPIFSPDPCEGEGTYYVDECDNEWHDQEDDHDAR
jgi:hypothetical protein